MTLYQRHVLNLSQIRRETNDHVAMYFYTNEHTDDDYSVIVIEKLYKDDIYRKFREPLWKKNKHDIGRPVTRSIYFETVF